MSLLFEDETYKILGACFEVYKEKGCGFLESVYQECLEIEFALQGISFLPQRRLALSDKGRPLKSTFKPDFVCLFLQHHRGVEGAFKLHQRASKSGSQLSQGNRSSRWLTR